MKPALHQRLELFTLFATEACLFDGALPAVNLLLALGDRAAVAAGETPRDGLGVALHGEGDGEGEEVRRRQQLPHWLVVTVIRTCTST